MGSFRRSAESYHAAMTLCADARSTEFIAPLQLAAPAAGELLVDFPSGGGYLEAWLVDLAPGARYQAVEQVKQYMQIVDNICYGDWGHLNFPAESVDIVLSLAALHHLFPDRSIFYRESHRVLATAGRLVIADVAKDTAAARFLSEFVGVYSPEGHEAEFFDQQKETEIIEAEGFDVVHYQIHDLPWHYPDKVTAIEFCRGLFRLQGVDNDSIWSALHDYLGITMHDKRVTMNWQLALIRADKTTKC